MSRAAAAVLAVLGAASCQGGGPAATRAARASDASPAIDAASGGSAAAAWRRPAAGAASSWQAPVPRQLVLPSGLTVWVLAESGLLVAQVAAIVKAGSANDGDREGLAAATAEMVIAGGAGRRSGPEVAAAFAALGDEPEVQVDGDNAVFHLTVPPSRLGPALALLGEVLASPRFDEGQWRRERVRRVAALTSEGDEPAAVADRVFARVYFGDHPYGHPAAGRARDVARLEVDDLRAFHAAHFGPRATTLVLVLPRAPTAEPAELARVALEGWPEAPPASTVPAVPPALTPVAAASRLVLVDRPGARQSELRVGGGAVARSSPQFPSAMLLETVLGGSFTSRLVQNLRERHGYAYDVAAAVVAADAPAPLVVATAVRSDATAAAVGEIRQEIRRLREPLTPIELARARALVQGVVASGFGDGQGTARLLADAVGHGADGAWWSRLPAELAGVDAERLVGASAGLCDADHLTVVVVGDRRAVEAELRALPGAGPLEVRQADGEPSRSATSRPRAASVK